jgi:hypothetical protein
MDSMDDFLGIFPPLYYTLILSGLNVNRNSLRVSGSGDEREGWLSFPANPGPDRGRGRWAQAGTRMTKKRVMKAMSTFSRPAFGSLLLKDKEYRFGFGYAWASRNQVI